MSNQRLHAVCRKVKNPFWFGQDSPPTLAIFGSARLVRKLDGRHELVGSTADDHTAAREWGSRFAPEIVFTSANRRNPAIVFAA